MLNVFLQFLSKSLIIDCFRTTLKEAVSGDQAFTAPRSDKGYPNKNCSLYATAAPLLSISACSGCGISDPQREIGKLLGQMGKPHANRWEGVPSNCVEASTCGTAPFL